jgi:hypothetical protein
MLAVANSPHRYCRNRHYYLRLRLNQKQIWISLKTESLGVAVYIRSQIKSLLANSLVISKLDACQLSNFLLTIKQKVSTARKNPCNKVERSSPSDRWQVA